MQRKQSPYFRDGRFANYPGEQHARMFWRSIGAFSRLVFCRYSRLKEDLAPWIASTRDIPSGDQQITWLGHSTFLITLQGTTVITDPVFDTLSVIFKRIPPKLSCAILPKVDVVLISHNHRDHMDEPALRALEKSFNPLILVPLGDGAWFKKRGFKRVQEAIWWEQFPLSSTLTATFLPARHWSQRGLFDRNKSLWGSWMLHGNGTPDTPRIYFAGDTAYGEHFKAIAHEFAQIDIALMPIGPSAPDELMRDSHVNAEEACQAFLDLKATTMIPMHWGTYRLGIEHPLEPLNRLQTWWHNNADKTLLSQLMCMQMGQTKQMAELLSRPFVSIPAHELSLDI